MNAKTRIASGNAQVKKDRTRPRRAKDLGVEDGARAVKGGVSLAQACASGSHFQKVQLELL